MILVAKLVGLVFLAFWLSGSGFMAIAMLAISSVAAPLIGAAMFIPALVVISVIPWFVRLWFRRWRASLITDQPFSVQLRPPAD
jgi:hypothetical protein